MTGRIDIRFLLLSFAAHGAVALGWVAFQSNATTVALAPNDDLHLVVVNSIERATPVHPVKLAAVTSRRTTTTASTSLPTTAPAPEISDMTERVLDPTTDAPVLPPLVTPDLEEVAATPATDRIESAKTLLLSRLRQLFEIEKTYPALAVRQGWQGDVLLAFQIAANGSIENVHVAHSSGYALLDQSAVLALRRVGHVQEASGMLDDARANLEFLVRYQLREG